MDLRFDGELGESVMGFLELFGRFSSQLELADNMAFKVIPKVLSGRAKTWYWANQFRDVNHFQDELKATFGFPNYQTRLKRDLYNRTQGRLESLSEYLIVMNNMNQRLEKKLSQDELLEIVCSNLNPDNSWHLIV